MKISKLFSKPHSKLMGGIGDRAYANMFDIYSTVLESGCTDLTLFISSHGGDAASCAAILFLLRDLKKRGVKLTTVGGGWVASAGFIIFMEGQRRYALPETCFLTHKPSIGLGYGSFTENDLKELLIPLKKSTMLNDHLQKIKMSKKQKSNYSEGKDVEFSVWQGLKNGILTGRLV